MKLIMLALNVAFAVYTTVKLTGEKLWAKATGQEFDSGMDT